MPTTIATMTIIETVPTATIIVTRNDEADDYNDDIECRDDEAGWDG